MRPTMYLLISGAVVSLQGNASSDACPTPDSAVGLAIHSPSILIDVGLIDSRSMNGISLDPIASASASRYFCF